jgi:hypothetical protein
MENKYTWNGIDHSDKLGSLWQSKDDDNRVVRITSIKWSQGYGILVKYEDVKSGIRYSEGSLNNLTRWYKRIA